LLGASNAESEEARAERLRRRREADRQRRQRETGAERDARFVRNSVLAVLYFKNHTDWLDGGNATEIDVLPAYQKKHVTMESRETEDRFRRRREQHRLRRERETGEDKMKCSLVHTT